MSSNDFFMRQIEAMGDLLTTLIFDQTAGSEEDEQYETQISSDIHTLLLDLRLMLAQKQINEAENLLFQRMEEDRDINFLDAARQFYAWLHEMDDEELARCDYSREEIREGIEAACRFYGVVPEEEK